MSLGDLPPSGRLPFAPRSTCLLVLLLVISFQALDVFVAGSEGSYFLNGRRLRKSPRACLLSLLLLAALAGARRRGTWKADAPAPQNRALGKAAYLGGRFLAAFALGALIMSAIPVGLLAAALLPGEHADMIGPLRPAAYLSAYFLLALPNAFVAMALMFSAATFGRRGVVSYLGGAFVFFAAVVSWQLVAATLGYWNLAKLTDPLGLTLIGELSSRTTGQKRVVVGPQGRALEPSWVGVARRDRAHLPRFQFAHIASRTAAAQERRRETPAGTPHEGGPDRAHAIAATARRPGRRPASTRRSASDPRAPDDRRRARGVQ